MLWREELYLPLVHSLGTEQLRCLSSAQVKNALGMRAVLLSGRADVLLDGHRLGWREQTVHKSLQIEVSLLLLLLLPGS